MVKWVDESLASAAARFCLILYMHEGCRAAAQGFGDALFIVDGDPDASLREFDARLPRTWADVRERSRLGFPIRLNVGGHQDCAPVVFYWDFICVGFHHLQQHESEKGAGEPDWGLVPFFASLRRPSPHFPWSSCTAQVEHDITERFDLPDNSVDEVLSEHVLEHLPLAAWPDVLYEVHRVLKPGGILRLALPDYGAPMHAAALESGFDADDPSHRVLPTAGLLRAFLDGLGVFPSYHLRQYWEGEAFVDEEQRPAYAAATGHVKRCPENAALWKDGNCISPQFWRKDEWGRPEGSSLVVDMHKHIA